MGFSSRFGRVELFFSSRFGRMKWIFTSRFGRVEWVFISRFWRIYSFFTHGCGEYDIFSFTVLENIIFFYSRF